MNYQRLDGILCTDITVLDTIDAHGGEPSIKEEMFTLSRGNQPLVFVYPITRDAYNCIQVFNLTTHRIAWVKEDDVIFPLDYDMKVRRKGYAV